MFGTQTHYNGQSFDIYTDGVKTDAGYPSILAVAKSRGTRAICNGDDSMRNEQWIQDEVLAVTNFIQDLEPERDNPPANDEYNGDPNFTYQDGQFNIELNGETIREGLVNLSQVLNKYGYVTLSNPDQSVKRHPAIMRRVCELITEQCAGKKPTNRTAARAMENVTKWEPLYREIPDHILE